MYEDVVSQDVGTEPLGVFVGMLVLLLVLLLCQLRKLVHGVCMSRRHNKETCARLVKGTFRISGNKAIPVQVATLCTVNNIKYWFDASKSRFYGKFVKNVQCKTYSSHRHGISGIQVFHEQKPSQPTLYCFQICFN